MKNAAFRAPSNRMTALLLSLFLLLSPLASLAQPTPPPVSFTLTWTSGDGSQRTQEAVPVASAMDPNVYWLYADQDALNNNAILTIRDNTGMYPGGFSVQDGQPLTGLLYQDAGAAMEEGAGMLIQAFDVNKSPVAVFQLYISSVAQMPPEVTPSDPVVQPALVDIQYLNADTQQPVAEAQQQTLQEGQWPVTAAPVGLPETMKLVGEATQTVTVDINGANPNPVVFYYREELPVVQPALVNIQYLNADTQQPVAEAQQQTLQEGQWPVTAAPVGLPETMKLVGEATQTVTVDINGANPNPVVFYYREELPVVQPALVDIQYLNADTQQPVAEAQQQTLQEGQWPVTAAPVGLPETMKLVGEATQTVTVDINGASPNPVVFYYREELPVVQPALVDIQYLNADTQQPVAEAQQQTLQEGQWPVTAAPVGLPETMKLVGEATQTVTVDINGASPNPVVFYYREELPVVQPALVDIYYLNADTQQPVAEAQQQTLQEGQWPVTAAPVGLPETMKLVGEATQTVTVDINGANPNPVVFYYREELPVVQPALVDIQYLNADTQQPVAEAQQQTLQEGQWPVTAAPVGLPETMKLVGEATQTVTVDINGANPNPVVFYYREELPVVQPAVVDIQYLNADTQQPVAEAQQQTLQEGQWPVTAAPVGLPETMKLVGEATQTVTVDINGASPNPVVFYYREEVAAINATVTVRYVNDADDEPLAADETRTLTEAQTEITPQAAGLEGYQLVSAGSVVVTAAGNTADPAVVVFRYKVPVQDVHVEVHYLNRANNQPVAEAQVITLAEGTHPVQANPANLPASFSISGEATQNVTVIAAGAQPNPVVFYYDEEISVVAQPTDVPVRYLNEEGVAVASETVVRLVDGTNPVTAAPTDLQSNYELRDDQVQYVTMSVSVPAPEAITFYYRLKAVASETPVASQTPATPKVVLVPVLYRDQFGADIPIAPQNVSAKENEQNIVQINLSLLPEQGRWVLNDDAQKVVTVDANGVATPAQVVFQFTDTKPNITGQIPVHYRNEQGTAVADSTAAVLKLGINDVLPQPANLPEGYTLLTQSPQKASLSENGAVSPAEIVFVYRAPAVVTEAPTTPPYTITPVERYAYPYSDSVSFRSEPRIQNDNLITTVTTKDLVHITGETVNELDEIWYYGEINGTLGFIKKTVVKLLTDEQVNELLGITPSPSPVPTPAPTAIPEGMPIDRWATVNKNDVNFRSEPDTTAKTFLFRQSTGDRVWVLSQDMVGDKLWYKVIARNRESYVMAEYLNLMSLEESEQYQASLASPVPKQTTQPTTAPATEAPATPAPQTATPAPTTAPTQAPVTAAPTAAPVATPVFVQGYGLTTQQVALRTGASSANDETILATLPVSTLVYLWGQVMVDQVAWDHVDVIRTSQSGYMPDSAIRRIDKAEADYQLSLLNQVTASPAPTAVPPRTTGYALTKGPNVPMRTHFNNNAQIQSWLPENTIVAVLGQEYDAGNVWHTVQYGARYGYVRADQLRMLTADETNNYIASLRQPTPAPIGTLAPVTQNTLSSYGYVTADKVRLRKEANTQSVALKVMDKNAFALVQSSVQQPDGLWYQINQGGTQGYVKGDYFTVLALNQLSSYLQSPAYQNANNAGTTGTTGTGTGTTVTGNTAITPVEDFNTGVWQNPALAQATYEPFSPIATPTLEVEAIATPEVSTSPGAGFVVDASATIDPLATFAPMGTEAPQKAEGGGFPVGWLAVGLIAVLGGGGYYAYRMYQDNQRKAAQRAAQRRQQAQAQGGRPTVGGSAVQTKPGAQQPTQPMRPQQGQPTPQQPGSPYAPPVRPQGTSVYPPVTPSAGTQQRPGTVQQPGQPQRPGPVQQPGQQPPAGTPGAGQGTTTYRPTDIPRPLQGNEQRTPPTQGTTQYRPPQTSGSAGPQGTTPYRPVQQPTRPTPPEAPKAGAPGDLPPDQSDSASGDPRKRRTDRHG